MEFFSRWLFGLKLANRTTLRVSSTARVIPFWAFSALSVFSSHFNIAHAQTASNKLTRQDPVQIHHLLQQFIDEQSNTLPGQVTLQVAPLDSRLSLAQCDQPQPFIPKGDACGVKAPWACAVPARRAGRFLSRFKSRCWVNTSSPAARLHQGK